MEAAQRRKVVGRHHLAHPTVGAVDVVVLDVSKGGFRAKAEDDLMVDEIVKLRVDHDVFIAQIGGRWEERSEAYSSGG
jgi:hypothetical protein